MTVTLRTDSDLAQLKEQLGKSISECKNLNELKELRQNISGKKGVISSFYGALVTASPEEKKQLGNLINQLREFCEERLERITVQFQDEEINNKIKGEFIDISLPHATKSSGTIHPVAQVINEVLDIFGRMGFVLCSGPDIEDDYHNFSALNIPEHHPARQMHDTFYIEAEEKNGKKTLLRTHTSTVQIRTLKNVKPPFKGIALGKTFRSDSDRTHTPMFHQLEGFLVDKNVTMGHLKYYIEQFLGEFFNSSDIKTKFRASFFPFTSPSAEVDIAYSLDNNGVIQIGRASQEQKYLEIMGCGMIHPNVLKECGVDKEYNGFAFGIGIERLVMLKYGVNDIRKLFTGEMSWVKSASFVSSQG